jgi:hypothetical protein
VIALIVTMGWAAAHFRARGVAALLSCAWIAGCGAAATDGDRVAARPALHAEFRADPDSHAGEETYICYSFEVAALAGLHLGKVTWHPPSGNVVLHHASLYAAAGSPDVGEVPCDPMPERVAALGVYTPGTIALELPAGVAISLPPGTGRLVVVAHALRLAEGPAEPTIVDLEPAIEPVEHFLNWVDVFAPVPVLYPHESATSAVRCRFDHAVHIVSVWPHMHRFGSEAHAMIIRSDGRSEPLLDVNRWDFDHQLTYPVDASLEPGDSIQALCSWMNPTAASVLPGPNSTDEMCNHGLFVWPFDHAVCTP